MQSYVQNSEIFEFAGAVDTCDSYVVTSYFCIPLISIYYSNANQSEQSSYSGYYSDQELCKEGVIHKCFHNRCSKTYRNIHRKTPVLESLFNKVEGVKACDFNEISFQHWYFPVNISKFLRVPFSQNSSRRVLLFMSNRQSIEQSSTSYNAPKIKGKQKAAFFYSE